MHIISKFYGACVLTLHFLCYADIMKGGNDIGSDQNRKIYF